jgi:hypothetical protein
VHMRGSIIAQAAGRMVEEAQKCGDVYAVWRDGIGRTVAPV